MRGDLQLLAEARDSVLQLTEAVARSAGGPPPPDFVDAEDLARGGIAAAARTLMPDRKKYTPPELIAFESAQVCVPPNIAIAIGSVIANGIAYNRKRAVESNRERAVELRGRVLEQGRYEITIRDHGVSPKERPAALERIEDRISLKGTIALGAMQERTREWEGYGIGLFVAKLQLVCAHGWMTAEAPASGNGVVFRILLPRTPPVAEPA